MPQDNLLSGLFKTLGAAGGSAFNQKQVDTQTGKQDALQMFMAVNQQANMDMARERHKQALLEGAQNIKLNNLKMKDLNSKMTAIALPEIEKDKQYLEALGLNLSGGLEGLKGQLPEGAKLDFGGITLENPIPKQPVQEKPNAYNSLTLADRLFVEKRGMDAWLNTKQKGKVVSETESQKRSRINFEQKQNSKKVISRASKFWNEKIDASVKDDAGVSSIVDINDMQKALEYLQKSGGTYKSGFFNDKEDEKLIGEMQSLIDEYLASYTATDAATQKKGFGPDGSFPTQEEYDEFLELTGGK